MSHAVEASAVVRRHPGGRGIGPLDLVVACGESLALMGENGAGKTTLLRLLASVDRPQSGAMRWEGSADPRRARASLGLALDAAVEEESLSGRQAATFWCRQWVRDGDAARRLVDAQLERFELDAVADEPVGAYSFGMRRRLALIAALSHEPRLTLLDEPTAGLDPAGSAVLAAEIARRSQRGLATVVASNDPGFVERACSRVSFLSSGRLIHDGTTASLLEAVGVARVAELTLTSSLDTAALLALPGVEAVVDTGSGLEVHFEGEGTLAAIVALADQSTGRLRRLQLRDRDLRDSFRSLVGTRLEVQQ